MSLEVKVELSVSAREDAECRGLVGCKAPITTRVHLRFSGDKPPPWYAAVTDWCCEDCAPDMAGQLLARAMREIEDPYTPEQRAEMFKIIKEDAAKRRASKNSPTKGETK